MKIQLKNVRLSFPHLFDHAQFGGESTGKFEASFILDKTEHADQIKVIEDAIAKMSKEAFKAKLPSDKVALKDGDDTGREELAGKMTIKGSTKKRPIVIDRDKTPIAESDGKIYAGCYVNAILTLWSQNNNYGKRINAQLDGVQFVKDGEPFGDSGISVDAFNAFATDDEGEEYQFI